MCMMLYKMLHDNDNNNYNNYDNYDNNNKNNDNEYDEYTTSTPHHTTPFFLLLSIDY